MLIKTPLIVLGNVKYGDNSIILKTYSRESGLVGIIAGGVRSKKGVVKPSMIQPLSQLDTVYYERSKGDLKRLKEASVRYNYEEVFYDPVKNCIALFLAEVLTHLIHEEEPNPELYEFLERSFCELDLEQDDIANFHLKFLYNLTAYAGIAPDNSYIDRPFFDLMEGYFCLEEPIHSHYLHGEELQAWKVLSAAAGSENSKLPLGNAARRTLLRSVLEYYRLHIKDFGELRSIDVLQEVLS